MHVGLSGRQTGAAEREDERPQPQRHVGGIFPGRDQDRVRIVRQDDQSLGFGCAEALKIASPWPKITLVGLSGRQAGDAEREDKLPQPLRHVGGVFPRRDQDCFGIVGQDDQSLGFGCAGVLKIAPPRPKLTPAGLSGRQAAAAEREDERAQQLHHVGGVFPGRDEDRVRIGRQDDQSLGYRQLVSQRPFVVQRYHPAICLAHAVAEQIQHDVS